MTLSRYEIMELTAWEKTLHFYPKMAEAGYTFVTNIYKTDNVRPEQKAGFDTQQRYIQGKYYIVVKIIVCKHLVARQDSGKIDHDFIPLFGKLKEV